MKVKRLTTLVNVEVMGDPRYDHETLKNVLGQKEDSALFLSAYDDEDNIIAQLFLVAISNGEEVFLLHWWEDESYQDLLDKLFLRASLWAEDIGSSVIHYQGKTDEGKFLKEKWGFKLTSKVYSFVLGEGMSLKVLKGEENASSESE